MHKGRLRMQRSRTGLKLVVVGLTGAVLYEDALAGRGKEMVLVCLNL